MEVTVEKPDEHVETPSFVAGGIAWSVAFLAAYCLSAFVTVGFVEIFSELNIELPAVTKIVLRIAFLSRSLIGIFVWIAVLVGTLLLLRVIRPPSWLQILTACLFLLFWTAIHVMAVFRPALLIQQSLEK